jgi:hypothetical protein
MKSREYRGFILWSGFLFPRRRVKLYKGSLLILNQWGGSLLILNTWP